MAQTVGDFVIDRLAAWGVRRIYGYSGDGIAGLLVALQAAEGKLELVTTRHEEMAALMACAHAKFTGERRGRRGEGAARQGRRARRCSSAIRC